MTLQNKILKIRLARLETPGLPDSRKIPLVQFEWNPLLTCCQTRRRQRPGTIGIGNVVPFRIELSEF